MKKVKRSDAIHLDEKTVRYWFSIVMKVNNDFELDEEETEMLGMGLKLLDEKNVKGELRPLVIRAKKYFEENS